MLLAVQTVAFGQTTAPKSRGFISVNGGYQINAASDFRGSATVTENAETRQTNAFYTLKNGLSFDVAGGALVWRQLGVSVGLTRFSQTTPATVNVSSPHPFFFSTPRTTSGEVTGLTREELAVHIQARGVFPVNDRVQVMVFGGPSFFQVKQAVINTVNLVEAYPYDDVSFSGVNPLSATESKMGFNGGVDVAFFFTDNIGVGGAFQFSRVTVDLPVLGGNTQSVQAGGVQAGGGLRLRF
jgi:hypothetical protein